ncbi:MAG TPA: TolC family protein, partial [Polyangiaceae bacterium]
MSTFLAASLVSLPLLAPRALPLMQAQPVTPSAAATAPSTTTQSSPLGSTPPAQPTPVIAEGPNAPPPTPARVLTLAEATRAALTQQPLVRQAQALTAAAAARADEARSPLLPQVTGTAAYQISTANYVLRPGAVPAAAGSTTSDPTFNTYNYWSFGISANQLIYDFGQTWGRFGAAKLQAESQEQTERATRFQTLLNVRTTFFLARAQKALVASSRETLANQDRHLSQVQGFVELGTRPEIDLAQSRTDVANAKLALITAENNYATARAQLNSAMGSTTSSDYDVSDETLSPVPEEDQPLETLVHTAYTSRPELAALSKLIEADQKLIGAAKGGYGPTLGA